MSKRQRDRGVAKNGPTAAVLAVLLASVAVGGALRVAAAQGDLWLDEIYSILWVRDLGSAGEIFTGLRQDNNHHLNSLWLYWVRDFDRWVLYRALALFTGIAAIAIAPFAAGRRDLPSVGVTSAIFATSFPLITYSSEARGYAPMLCFALASLVLLRHALHDARPGACLAFGASVALGFLSHLSFGHCYFAAFAWSLWIVWRRRLGPRRGASVLLRIHLLPAVFLVGFYLSSLRDLYVAGAPPKTLFETVTEISALSIGVPFMGSLAGPALAVVAGLAVTGVVSMWRAGSDFWVFCTCAMLLVPGALLVLRPPEVVFARYFLVSIVAFLLLLGSLLGDWLRRAGPLRWAAAAVLLAICAGNGVEIARFLEYGRGGYLEALTAMADATRGDVIEVGSDHPFRNGSLLVYYEPYLPAGKRFEYVRTKDWLPTRGPEWYLRHDLALHPEPPTELVLRGRYVYELFASYPYYGLSGWHWSVYHRKGIRGRQRVERSPTTAAAARWAEAIAPSSDGSAR